MLNKAQQDDLDIQLDIWLANITEAIEQAKDSNSKELAKKDAIRHLNAIFDDGLYKTLEKTEQFATVQDIRLIRTRKAPERATLIKDEYGREKGFEEGLLNLVIKDESDVPPITKQDILDYLEIKVNIAKTSLLSDNDKLKTWTDKKKKLEADRALAKENFLKENGLKEAEKLFNTGCKTTGWVDAHRSFDQALRYLNDLQKIFKETDEQYIPIILLKKDVLLQLAVGMRADKGDEKTVKLRFDQARECIDLILQKYPWNKERQWQRIELLMEADNTEDVPKIFLSHLQLDLNDTSMKQKVMEKLNHRGKICIERGEWGEARRWFQRANVLDLNNIIANQGLKIIKDFEKGKEAAQAGDFDSAAEFFKLVHMFTQQLALNETAVQGYVAKVWKDAGDEQSWQPNNYDAVTYCFEKAYELDQNDTDVQQKLARALYYKSYSYENDLDAAINCLQRACTMFPTDIILAGLENALGLQYSSRGDLDNAINCFETARKLDLNSTWFKQNLIKALTQKRDKCVKDKNLNEAIKCGVRLLQLKPDDSKVQHHLADLQNSQGVQYSLSGELDNAIDCFEKAYDLEPTSNILKQNLKKALTKKRDQCVDAKNLDDAIRYNRRHLDLDPKDAILKKNAAFLLTSKGEQESLSGNWYDASSHFEEAYRLEPTMILKQKLVAARNGLGKKYLESEESLSMIRGCFERAHELDPDNMTTKQGLKIIDYLEEGEASMQEDYWDAAIQSFYDVRELAPDNPTANKGLAKALSSKLEEYIQENEWSEMIEWSKQISEIYSKDEQRRYDFAKIYFDAGNAALSEQKEQKPLTMSKLMGKQGLFGIQSETNFKVSTLFDTALALIHDVKTPQADELRSKIQAMLGSETVNENNNQYK